MRITDLSLPPRLGLAVLSGILTFPAILVDSALGPTTYPPVFSWWIILHGLLFGFLVMAPFVTSRHRRRLRAVILALASVLIYDAAIRIPDLVALEFLGELGDFIVAGVSGAVLVATAVRYIAPLAVAPAYWVYCIIAGLAGGAIFAYTFGACDWDQCSPSWRVVPYAFGWVAWQALVCAAMYTGRNRPETTARIRG